MKVKQEEQNKDLESPVMSLTDRQRKIILSPLRLLLIIGGSVSVIEFFDMLFIEKFSSLSTIPRTLLDTSLLILTLIPIFYFYLFRPLVSLVQDYRAHETRLKTDRRLLEQKVAERTSDLEETLECLKTEYLANQSYQKALGESEERFRQLFDQTEDAIILIAPEDGTVIDINPTAEHIFKTKKEDILKNGLAALFPQSAELLKTIFDKMALNNSPTRIDRFECTIAPGDVRIFSFRGKPITLQGARIAYATFRDITTRVRLEEEALEIQARLIHANRMTSLGMLVSSVAHEINNPNNYILLNATLLQQTWKDIYAALRERFEREGEFMIGRITFSEAAALLPEAYKDIIEGSHRISEIVDNLKNHGRNDRALTGVANLNEIVRLSVSLLNHLITRTTHHFTLELDEHLPSVRGSVGQLQQVVINLITNALQALPDASHGIRILTSMAEDDQHVILCIQDEGDGIPEEIALRIMEPFFTTRLDKGGTGLGLAICYNIVNDHGGTITFDSVQGKGTKFTVCLQRAEEVNCKNPSAIEAIGCSDSNVRGYHAGN